MRRSGVGARVPVWKNHLGAMITALAVAGAGALASSASGGCLHQPRCDGLSCAAACPRNAATDADGRCECADGDVPMLGACVPPPVAATLCGPASRLDANGCVFKSCGAGESLDAVSGACVARASLPHGGAMTCVAPTVPVLEEGRVVCVSPEAKCPRGTSAGTGADAEAGANAGVCVRPLRCPPGSLPDGRSCRPVVTVGGRTSGTRVDVGAWVALALGIDGGRGTPWLCQPLAQQPHVFAGPLRDLAGADGGGAAGTAGGGRSGSADSEADGGAPSGPSDEAGDEDERAHPDATAGADPEALASAPAAEPLVVRVAITATFPDEDISRLHAKVSAFDRNRRPLPPDAEALVSGSVETILELLRGLGGESSAAAVALEVACTLPPDR